MVIVFFSDCSSLRDILNKEGIHEISIIRGSRSKMFFGIGVLGDFAVYAGKLKCWSLFFIKLQLYSEETPVFSCGNWKSFESSFCFVKHLWWLLLNYLYFKSCVFEFQYFAFHYLVSDINIYIFL